MGKSSLVIRFVNHDYVENREPTIGGKRIVYISYTHMYIYIYIYLYISVYAYTYIIYVIV